MGLCKIEGEPGSLLYISFSKEVSLLEMSGYGAQTAIGNTVQDGDTLWYAVRLSEKANSFIYVDDNREWSLKPLEEDVQITVKTDLDVVEKWSQWPEEITIPAKTTKNVEFIPTEPGDYLMPDSDGSERYFSVMDEWRYCNTYYKTTDKTVYEGISVSSCTADNQARISIR